MLSPGSATVSCPSRRSRTAPSRSGSTQLKQMPIRQPDGISTPAASPESSNGSEPSVSTTVPDRLNVTVPPPPPVSSTGRKRSVRSRCPLSSSAQCVSRSSSISFGPQAQVCRSNRSGTSSARSAGLSRPSARVCRSISRIRPSAARARSSEPKTTASAVRAECTTTTSDSSCSALRSMPMTGVMPLPAVMNSALVGRGAQSVNSPAGRSMCRIAPRLAARSRWVLTTPSGTALTVMVIRPSRRPGGLVIE